MLTYLKWLLIFVWLPTFLLWAMFYKILGKYKKIYILSVLWAVGFVILWDNWAIRTHIWAFPPDTNVGIWIMGLPLEEYLFAIFVTFEISTLTLVLKHTTKL